MERTSQQNAARSRRWITGVMLVVAVSASGLVAGSFAAPDEPGAGEMTASNPTGMHRTIHLGGAIDADNPFFRDLGTNGRTCFTCHRPAQAWTITPGELRDRFERTSGLDPIFRTNDASNCEAADVGTVEQRRRAFSLLLTRGVIRVGRNVPPAADFEVVDVDDPYGCGALFTSLSLYRRPLPTTNLAFLSAVMWDGRETTPGLSIRDDLIVQARNATVGHAQGAVPSAVDVRAIVDFELGLFTAQAHDTSAGGLNVSGARGGPRFLRREPFCIGTNDPLGMLPSVPGACSTSSGFDPIVFTLFDAWASDRSWDRQAIARGEAIFNTRRFVIDNVPGLNGDPADPVSGPVQNATCTVCHDTPNAGNHSVAMVLNIGTADASRRTPDLPLYTLRNRTTGELVQTTDPGRAMVTGRWTDIGKFKGPILRALAARGPFFHDGSAATLSDVVAFYDTRFNVGLSAREKADLIAFLQAL